MEFVFALTEGRRAVIYDEGNQIMLLFVLRGNIVNRVVLEREYHSELDAIVYNNKIYLAYMTVSYAIAWMELGGTGRVILYANDTNRCHVGNLTLKVIADKLVLFYKNELEDKKTWRLQYIMPLENRKSYMLCEREEKSNYELDFVGKKAILIISFELDVRHYYIEENANKRYELKEFTVMSNSEINQLEEKKEEQEHTKLQYEKERTQLEEAFKRQYNELVEFTKQLQEEGKKWREMYYRSVQNKPQNT